MSANTTEADDVTETEEDLAPADEVDGRIMADIAREHRIGAGAVKGSLAIDAPDCEADCQTKADEAALEARRRAAKED